MKRCLTVLMAALFVSCGGGSEGEGVGADAVGEGGMDITFPDDPGLVETAADSDAGDTAEAQSDTALDPGTDPGPADLPAEDPGTMDTPPVDPGPPDVPFVPTCAASVEIVQPESETFFHVAQQVSLEAQVTTTGDPTQLGVWWKTAAGFIVATGDVDALGASTTTATGLPPGTDGLIAQVFNGDGPCEGAPASQTIIVCKSLLADDFTTLDSAVWQVFKDASWDPGGWIEMTGNVGGKQGAIYDVKDAILSGHVSWAFKFAVGGGGNPIDNRGGDGMAATIIAAEDLAQLKALLEQAQPGGGLGYGLSGAYGTFAGEAMTVEIDTWHNDTSVSGDELHTDPGFGPHVAVTLDADPGNHLVWVDTPDIEDLQWRDLRVEIVGTTVRVFLDGTKTIDTTIPGLDFRGGYLFFSGSTGWAWEYNRFDDVRILHNCF